MDVAGSEAVLLRRQESVTQLILNRPASLNSIDEEMAAGIRGGLDLVRGDRRCRALVITGAGRGFCSGQALPTGGTDVELPADVAGLVRTRYLPIVTKIRDLPIPVIASVNGVAAGAGFSLALAADFRVASDAAWFSSAFARIGLVPDSGASFFLARYLGFPRALEVALTGRRISALEARDLGLVSRVFPAASFAEDSSEFARELAAGPTRAFGLTKRALSRALTNTLEEQLELEATLQQAASETDDFREGLRAFRDKRVPKFEGR